MSFNPSFPPVSSSSSSSYSRIDPNPNSKNLIDFFFYPCQTSSAARHVFANSSSSASWGSSTNTRREARNPFISYFTSDDIARMKGVNHEWNDLIFLSCHSLKNDLKDKTKATYQVVSRKLSDQKILNCKLRLLYPESARMQDLITRLESQQIRPLDSCCRTLKDLSNNIPAELNIWENQMVDALAPIAHILFNLDRNNPRTIIDALFKPCTFLAPNLRNRVVLEKCREMGFSTVTPEMCRLGDPYLTVPFIADLLRALAESPVAPATVNSTASDSDAEKAAVLERASNYKSAIDTLCNLDSSFHRALIEECLKDYPCNLIERMVCTLLTNGKTAESDHILDFSARILFDPLFSGRKTKSMYEIFSKLISIFISVLDVKQATRILNNYSNICTGETIYELEKVLEFNQRYSSLFARAGIQKPNHKKICDHFYNDLDRLSSECLKQQKFDLAIETMELMKEFAESKIVNIHG